jgi:hypothetical protein
MKEKIAYFLGYCFSLSILLVGVIGLLALAKFFLEYLIK